MLNLEKAFFVFAIDLLHTLSTYRSYFSLCNCFPPDNVHFWKSFTEINFLLTIPNLGNSCRISSPIDLPHTLLLLSLYLIWSQQSLILKTALAFMFAIWFASHTFLNWKHYQFIIRNWLEFLMLETSVTSLFATCWMYCTLPNFADICCFFFCNWFTVSIL